MAREQDVEAALATPGSWFPPSQKTPQGEAIDFLMQHTVGFTPEEAQAHLGRTPQDQAWWGQKTFELMPMLLGGVRGPKGPKVGIYGEGSLADMLKSMKRIPPTKEALRVSPTTRYTPGQPGLPEVLGTVESEAGTSYNVIDPRTGQPQRIFAAESLPGQQLPAMLEAAKREPMNVVGREAFEKAYGKMASRTADKEIEKLLNAGLFQREWYPGSYPQLVQDLAELDKLLPSGLVKPGDPVRLAKMIGATSAATEPNANVYYTIKGWSQYLASGRDPQFAFKDLHMFRQASRMPNIRRAIHDEALSGPKYANYVLNILGSEQHATNDRWIVDILLGRKPKFDPKTGELMKPEGSISPIEYAAASQRLLELAYAGGMTPQRMQAALWGGVKILRDKRMRDLMAHGLSPEEASPALREIIALYMGRFRDNVVKNPQMYDVGHRKVINLGRGEYSVGTPEYPSLRDAVIADPKVITPAMGLALLLHTEAQREDQRPDPTP